MSELLDFLGEWDMEEVCLLTVDPSINHAGCARFDGGQPTRTWTINARKGMTLDQKLEFLVQEFYVYAVEEPVTLALIERPDEWARTAHPRATRPVNMGDLLKLAMAVGAIYSGLATAGVAVKTIPVGQWKGFQSKEATAARFKGRYGIELPSSHAADAAALGQWFYEEIGRARKWKVGLEEK